jgi:hypothetical protein
MFLKYLNLLLPPLDADVVKDGPDDDVFWCICSGPQGLQYGIFLLNYPEDVFCGYCPDLREPGVEFNLALVKGLSVGVWIHETLLKGTLSPLPQGIDTADQ